LENKNRNKELNLASYYRRKNFILPKQRAAYRKMRSDPVLWQAHLVKKRLRKPVDRAFRFKRISESDLTRQQLLSLYEESNGCCYICEAHVKAKFTPKHFRGFDHVVPISKGGKHTISNLKVCCKNCNTKKGNREAAYSE
jgi:5-methylcytosine-specific restriction endonuclease McrA